MEMLFVSTESTFGYFEATASYLRRHGKPVAFYSDKHSIFRVTREGLVRGPPGRHAVRPGAGRAQHRHHLRQHAAGQGPGRAHEQDPAGPAGQGAAASRDRHARRRQRVPAGVHGRFQRTVRPAPTERPRRASTAGAARRSRQGVLCARPAHDDCQSGGALRAQFVPGDTGTPDQAPCRAQPQGDHLDLVGWGGHRVRGAAAALQAMRRVPVRDPRRGGRAQARGRDDGADPGGPAGPRPRARGCGSHRFTGCAGVVVEARPLPAGRPTGQHPGSGPDGPWRSGRRAGGLHRALDPQATVPLQARPLVEDHRGWSAGLRGHIRRQPGGRRCQGVAAGG